MVSYPVTLQRHGKSTVCADVAELDEALAKGFKAADEQETEALKEACKGLRVPASASRED
jgi:hypothetical protein